MDVKLNFKITFQKNLKSTFKFLGFVIPAIALFIIFDSLFEERYANLMIVIYLVASTPLVVLSTAIYTMLKMSSLNKFICSVLFSFATTLFVIAYYFLTWFIDGSELDFDVLQKVPAVFFVILTALYLQLPLKNRGI
jgi:hypothetical protein